MTIDAVTLSAEAWWGRNLSIFDLGKDAVTLSAEAWWGRNLSIFDLGKDADKDYSTRGNDLGSDFMAGVHLQFDF